MNPILIHPCCYVLKCEDDCYYIGITHNLNQRLAQHFSGQGAKWTKLHKPLQLIETHYPATRQTEEEVTLDIMREFGWEKVRGGKYCSVRLTKPFELA